MRVGQALASRTYGDLDRSAPTSLPGWPRPRRGHPPAHGPETDYKKVKVVAWSAWVIPLAGVGCGRDTCPYFLLSAFALIVAAAVAWGATVETWVQKRPRAAAAGATSWRRRSGIPAPSTCRPGRTAPADQARAAHRRSCTSRFPAAKGGPGRGQRVDGALAPGSLALSGSFVILRMPGLEQPRPLTPRKSRCREGWLFKLTVHVGVSLRRSGTGCCRVPRQPVLLDLKVVACLSAYPEPRDGI